MAALITWAYFISTISSAVIKKYSKSEKDTVIKSAADAFPSDFYNYFVAPHVYAIVLANIVLYGWILVMTAQQSRKIGQLRQSKSTGHTRKMTRMMVIVVGVMLASSAPIAGISFIPQPDPREHLVTYLTYEVFYDFTIVVTFITSFTNAFIYAWHHRGVQTCLYGFDVHP